jgi:CheY-like chemotaxis protein
MRTVLLVEDSFVESYELEYRLKELGYTAKIAATLEGAKECLRQLDGGLAGIVCDNRLISGKPIAATFYAYARSRASSIPFIVYSAFPPWELRKDDPFLAVVRKPFMDDVLKHLRVLGPIAHKRETVLSIPSGREAA